MSANEPLTHVEYELFRAAVTELIDDLVSKLPEGGDRERTRELIEFRSSIMTESDRGSALMAAAFLDDKLGDLIRRRLVADVEAAGMMLDQGGPLGTFSARIEFCYLMGILPRNARNDLHLIRKVRNEFAHVAGPVDFDNYTIKSHCDNLALHGVRTSSPAGAKFRRAVMNVLRLVVYGLADVIHIPVMADVKPGDGKEIYDVVARIFEAQTGKPSPIRDQHYE